jgi:hypothetical protein
VSRRLRGEGVRVAQQIGDEVGGGLPLALGEPLESFSILALDADQDHPLPVRVSLPALGVARIELGQIAVEVAGLGGGACPGSLLIYR